MKCETCSYWFRLDKGFEGGLDEGQCRRYAPQMISGVGSGFSNQLHPETHKEHWCGEYQKSNDPKRAEVSR